MIFGVVELPCLWSSLKPQCTRKLHTLQTGLDTTLGTFATLGSIEICFLSGEFSSSRQQHIFGPSQQMSIPGDKKPLNYPSKEQTVHQEVCVDFFNFRDNFFHVSSTFWSPLMTLLSEHTAQKRSREEVPWSHVLWSLMWLQGHR